MTQKMTIFDPAKMARKLLGKKIGEIVICWVMFSPKMTQKKVKGFCVSARILGNLGNGMYNRL